MPCRKPVKPCNPSVFTTTAVTVSQRMVAQKHPYVKANFTAGSRSRKISVYGLAALTAFRVTLPAYVTVP